eukprot:COSAG06_NODE_2772_length_6304_cov_211.798872_4_plen_59_part_00
MAWVRLSPQRVRTLYSVLIIALQCALSLPVPCCFCGKVSFVLCCAVLCYCMYAVWWGV